MVWKAGQSQQQRRYLNGKKYFCNRKYAIRKYPEWSIPKKKVYKYKYNIYLFNIYLININIKDIWDPEDNHQSSSNFSARKMKTGNTRGVIEDM